jgi:hypothetical protein
MKTILIHSAYGRWPMLEYELDIAQREIDAGNRVVFTYCNGGQVVCEANNPLPGQDFKKRICLECKSRVKRGLKWLSEGKENFISVPYEKVNFSEREILNHIILKTDKTDKSKKKLKSLVDIDGTEIYDAAFSTLMTELRESNPDIELYWERFKELLALGISSYFSCKNHITNYAPDKIYLFNGRMSRYRPMVQESKRKRIQFFVYEYPEYNFENYVMSEGDYPQKIKVYASLLNSIYLNKKPKKRDVETAAYEWFNNRSAKIFKGIQKLILTNKLQFMANKTMPANWNSSKFNLVFFISSQDEISAINENISNLPYNQVEAVRAIKLEFPDIHFTVRIHPNLAGVDDKFVNDLSELSKIKDVRVIAPDSSIDSYSLIEAADLILCYGSTIGAEAAFRGKSVIVVGVSYYSEFNCCLHVQSHEKLIKVIGEVINGNFSSLPSKEERYNGACNFAWSFINNGVKPKYLVRNSYYGGHMIRNDVKSEINANICIVLINRIIEIIIKLLRGVSLFVSNAHKRDSFLKTPLKTLKNRFFV